MNTKTNQIFTGVRERALASAFMGQNTYAVNGAGSELRFTFDAVPRSFVIFVEVQNLNGTVLACYPVTATKEDNLKFYLHDQAYRFRQNMPCHLVVAIAVANELVREEEFDALNYYRQKGAPSDWFTGELNIIPAHSKNNDQFSIF
jgi:hypothetical protein